MKNQGNVKTSKEHNNLLVTDPKDLQIYELPYKEFKIAVLRKLDELQENTDKSIKSGNKTKQNEKFNKDI